MDRGTSKRAAGRPRDPAKARAILDAGWSLFLQRGVEATSIEAIAAEAGVSKVTLYSHYPDRTALFEAAVRREMERIEAAQGAPEAGAPASTADRLRGFGAGIMGFLATDAAIDFYSVLAGELRRHGDLARAFHDLGPGRTRSNLAALLAEGVACGDFVALDADRAAEELFGLWQGFTNFQLSLGVGVEEIRADLGRRVDRGVDLFLRLYGAAPPRSGARD